jgi:hypothetical protein
VGKPSLHEDDDTTQGYTGLTQGYTRATRGRTRPHNATHDTTRHDTGPKNRVPTIEAPGITTVVCHIVSDFEPESQPEIETAKAMTMATTADTETTMSPIRLPPGSETVSVRLINPVNFGPAILSRFMAPAVAELKTFPTSPSHSFLLEHASGRKLVFDLGIRKDYHNYSPSIAAYLPTTGYDIQVSKNVVDILEEGGVPPKEIEAVIWR